MGFFNTTVALLGALMSGEARLVTPEELKQFHTEIQSAHDRNQAVAAQNRITENQLAIAKAQHVQERSATLAQTLQDMAHAWEISQRECEVVHREYIVQSAAHQLATAQGKVMIEALQQQNYAWDIAHRKYVVQIALQLLKKAQLNALINTLNQQNHAWNIGQREFDLLFPNVPAIAKKQWNKSLVAVVSATAIATMVYATKRVYDAHIQVSPDNKSIIAVTKEAITLIKKDITGFFDVLHSKIFGKK